MNQIAKVFNFTIWNQIPLVQKCSKVYKSSSFFFPERTKKKDINTGIEEVNDSGLLKIETYSRIPSKKNEIFSTLS